MALRQLIARHGMLHPRIFGSVLTGKDTEDSDLDLLMDSPVSTTLLRLAALQNAAEDLLGVEVIDRACEYLAGVPNVNALRLDRQSRDAVILNIAIIREATTKLQQAAPEFVAAHPDIPWRDMSTMRGIV